MLPNLFKFNFRMSKRTQRFHNPRKNVNYVEIFIFTKWENRITIQEQNLT